MLLNYLRIQLLRFFKGRSWIVAILLAVVLTAISIGISSVVYHMLVTEGKFDDFPRVGNQGACDDEFIVPIVSANFCGLFLFPVACTLMTIVYVCNYYNYRTHINLEVKLRNRILFAISEALILLIMLGIFVGILGIAELIVCVVMHIPFKEILSLFKIPILYTTLLFPVSIYTAMMYGYFLAKLFRRKGRAIVVFTISYYFLFIISEAVVDMLPVSKFFIGFAFMVGESSFLYIFSLLIRISIIFAASVLLFHRRYEERHI